MNEYMDTVSDYESALKQWDYSSAVSDGEYTSIHDDAPYGFVHRVTPDIYFDDGWENFIILDGNTAEWVQFSADVLGLSNG